MKMRLIVVFAVTVMFAAPQLFAEPILITGGFVSRPSFSASFPAVRFSAPRGDGTAIQGVTFDQAGNFVRIGQVVNLSTGIFVTSLNAGPLL